MPGFDVSFTPQALEDILVIYEWGIDFWGEFAAEKWLRELYSCTSQRLTTFSKSCPLAPDSQYLDGEVRHLLFLRYRILFEIYGNLVVVLRVDGPHKGRFD